MRPHNHPWYSLILWLATYLGFGSLGGIRRRHWERVPLEGALIVAPNHLSHADPPAVACAIRRQLCFMAKEELFRVPILGPLIRSLGAFPVRRGANDTESIRMAIELLDRGKAVLIFPEGARGRGGVMLPINRGVAMLAKRTGAKVLPVGVVGSHRMWPRGQKLPKRARITVLFGEPFTYEEIAGGANERENRERFAAELESRILALCAEGGLELKSAGSTERSVEAYDPERSHESPGPASV